MELSLLIACLLALGLVCQWLAWRLALPAILPLLLAGLALGPGLGWLNPDRLLGGLLFPFVSLGVAVILFEGSLTLKISSVRNVGRIIRNLTTIGVVTTGAIMSLAAHYLVADERKLVELFALDENGKLKVFTAQSEMHPREGWALVSLVSGRQE